MLAQHLFKRNKKTLEEFFRGYVVSAYPLKIERVVVLSKMTKYEVEKHCNPGLTDDQLEGLLRSRGSDYDSLITHHLTHKDFEQRFLEKLEINGIKSKLFTRLNYSDRFVESCDAVFPVGGDGTFLLAAGGVLQNTLPVIGFNSDPDHSEGFLCLPKQYSVEDVLQRLKEGSFSWLFRTRIRVTVRCKNNQVPVKLHDDILCVSEAAESNEQFFTRNPKPAPCLRPSLALNEVFVGEQLSTQVSYFEVQTEGKNSTRVKCSGLCVCTGTGSSSWHLSMNRTTKEEVAQVLDCAGLPQSQYQPNVIADKFNQSLLFNPEESKMCYTIRDLICAGVWPSPPGFPPRAFARSLKIHSHGRDARLVIDGGPPYIFNDGSEALFQLLPEDALKTIVL